MPSVNQMIGENVNGSAVTNGAVSGVTNTMTGDTATRISGNISGGVSSVMSGDMKNRVSGGVSNVMSRDITDGGMSDAVSNNMVTDKLGKMYKNSSNISSVHRPNIRVPPLLLIALVYVGIFLYIFVIYDTLTTTYLARILTSGYILCKTAASTTDTTTPADTFQLYRNHWRENRWKVVLRKMGLFLFIFGSLFAFLLGVIYTFVMKGGQPLEAAKVIGICLATIVGTTFLIIDNQYFVTIFENTVGYKLTTMWKKTRDTLQSVFRHKSMVPTTGPTSEAHMFPGIRLVVTFLLSVFYMNNFGFVLQKIGSKDSTFDFTVVEEEDDDTTHIDHLAKCVVRKHTIGHLCWVYFASIVATMISTKYLAKMG